MHLLEFLLLLRLANFPTFVDPARRCCCSLYIVMSRRCDVIAAGSPFPLWRWLLALLACLDVASSLDIYTNHFLVHTHVPGAKNAHQIAKRNGFINRGPVNLELKFGNVESPRIYTYVVFTSNYKRQQIPRFLDQTRNGTSFNRPSPMPELAGPLDTMPC